jgi:hypothetical protein
MVANCFKSKQLHVHLQTYRNRLPPRNSCAYGWGTVLKDDPTTRPAVIGPNRTDSGTSRGKNCERCVTRLNRFPPSTQGAPSPPTRRQHRRGRYPHQAHHTVTRNDDRTAPPVIPARHQRHPYSSPLHPFRGKYLGRYFQPRIGHRGLAAQPPPLHPPASSVGTPFYRPLRFYAEHAATALQCEMARPHVRGRRLPTPSIRGLAPQKQLLQLPVDSSPNPHCQNTQVRRSRHRGGPPLAQQDVVPRPPPPCIPHLAFPANTRPLLPRQARQARRGRTNRLKRRGLSSTTHAWLYTQRGAIGQSLRAAHRASTKPPPAALPPVPGTRRYHLTANPTKALWSSSITTHFRTLLSTDKLGTTAIGLLSSSLDPSTYANYDNTLRHYFSFCAEKDLPPLKATPGCMVRYTAWLDLPGTMAASSVQPTFPR